MKQSLIFIIDAQGVSYLISLTWQKIRLSNGPPLPDQPIICPIFPETFMQMKEIPPGWGGGLHVPGTPLRSVNGHPN